MPVVQPFAPGTSLMSGFHKALPSFDLQIARGKIKNWRLVHAFGSNLSVAVSIEEDLWRPGGTLIYPASAGVVSISSTSADDSASGTGGQVLLLQGLDGDFNEIFETVVLNGTSTVNTVQSFYRINGAQLVAAGSVGWNVGDISGLLSGNPNIFINATDGASLGIHFTVPVGCTMYIQSASAWQGRDNSASQSLTVRPNGGPWLKFGTTETYRNFQAQIILSSAVPEKADVKIVGHQITGGGTTAIFANYIAFLERL